MHRRAQLTEDFILEFRDLGELLEIASPAWHFLRKEVRLLHRLHLILEIEVFLLCPRHFMLIIRPLHFLIVDIAGLVLLENRLRFLVELAHEGDDRLGEWVLELGWGRRGRHLDYLTLARGGTFFGPKDTVG